ncbi:MAG: hypothetical protein HGA76_10050 [Candidatus Firestonebacteria bacterium]|nr:hypothetical protein [Candidatus Firestonebacteria bacterium]
MNLYLAFDHQPLWFENPHELVSCHFLSELMPTFKKIERWLDAGWHVAGYLSYEAGYGFENRLCRSGKFAFPLMHMGAYRPPTKKKAMPGTAEPYQLSRLRLNTNFPEYRRAIQRIREYIAQGDVYQITYCIKNYFRFSGNPRRLFKELYRCQSVPYAAYVETGEHAILSLSPERFIQKTGGYLLTEPMKGTWPRGSHPAQDRRRRREFSRDPKNRAENLMIADLLRNDLGRIGTDIRAPQLFTIRAYKTLFQMTSTITGKVPRNLHLGETFRALFPSGSVTGAPKIRAMEIIREMEPEDRKIYTGAIGYITPERNLYFNIPIRTLLIRGNEGEMGVGGGIVWDSTPRGEWREGRLKSRFLRDTARRPSR